MLAQIISIKHAGSLGERGKDRTEPDNLRRIGAVGTLKYTTGSPFLFAYITDKDGSSIGSPGMISSRIQEIRSGKERLEIETSNSLYQFELLKPTSRSYHIGAYLSDHGRGFFSVDECLEFAEQLDEAIETGGKLVRETADALEEFAKHDVSARDMLNHLLYALEEEEE